MTSPIPAGGVIQVDKLKFGIVSPAGEEPKNLLRFIKRAEDSLFDSVWAGDHMVFMRPVAYDVMSTFAAAGVTTNRISLASISDAHKFHPAVLAQRLATLSQLTGGRFILGLGLGEAMNLDPYGIKWDKPLSRLVESVEIMRKLWRSDSPFDYEGEFFQLRQAILGAKPAGGGVHHGLVPIYIAAHREKSLRAAAELGDGWITLPQPPEMFASRRAKVEAWRGDFGGNLDNFERCLYIFASIAGDKNEAYEALEPLRHTIIWSELYEEYSGARLPEEFQRFGYMTVITTDDADRQRIVRQGRLYPKDAVLDFTLAGCAQDCIRRIEQYAASGVTHLLLHDFSRDRDESYKILTERVIPYFR
ncbi:MAG: LLM class flavin-dependent oxidoreductase [Deltaproteobacteria bacterium]